MSTRQCPNCFGQGMTHMPDRAMRQCPRCKGAGRLPDDRPDKPHLNVEDMDFVEGAWRKRRNERKGLV